MGLTVCLSCLWDNEISLNVIVKVGRLSLHERIGLPVFSFRVVGYFIRIRINFAFDGFCLY